MIAFAAIDNLWKGASGQGVQNLNLMLGLDETRGAAVSDSLLSRRRWVEPPPGVEELDPARAGAAASPPRASPAASRRAATPMSACSSAHVRALRFGPDADPQRRRRRRRSGFAVRLSSRPRSAPRSVKSGNANAATGEQGMRDALDDSERAAGALGLDLDPSQVAVAETGKIGVALPMDDVLDGIGRRRRGPPPRAAPSSPRRS